MILIIDHGDFTKVGTRYGCNSETYDQRGERMNALSEDVRRVTEALDPNEGRALATTYAYRAIMRLGIVRPENTDGMIPCQAWWYATQAGLSAADILAYGTPRPIGHAGGCAEPTCVEAPTTVISVGVGIDHIRYLMCDQHGRSHAIDGALIITTVVVTERPPLDSAGQPVTVRATVKLTNGDGGWVTAVERDASDTEHGPAVPYLGGGWVTVALWSQPDDSGVQQLTGESVRVRAADLYVTSL